MQVETFSMRKDLAEEKYQEYKAALKTRKDVYLKDMASVYGHMRHGRKIIDVFSAIPKAGLNSDGDPKLSICRADAKEVWLRKNNEGGCTFSKLEYSWRRRAFDVTLPQGSFSFPMDGGWIKRRDVKAPLPIIPAKFLPPYKLDNYYVLWEVEKWTQIPPRDPILLKRLTPNLFVSLAAWNLTDLEMAVLKGRVA